VKMPVEAACFDVAGPVIDGHVKTTNLPWTMDEGSLARELSLKSVRLVNDLEAVARAVPILRPQDLVTLNAGAAVERGPIAIIAPGTGLGESFLTWHSDFGPTDARQIRLLEYMLQRFDHVGFERVASGIGVPNVYDFLREKEGLPETPAVAARIAASKDRTKAILEAGADPQNPSMLCRATVDMVVSILAAETGNLALKVLATGGVYMAGGIAVHLLGPLREPRFMEAFTRKGRFKELMAHMPIHVITTRAALAGAAAYGLESLRANGSGAAAGRISS
jgi:glucokinase